MKKIFFTACVILGLSAATFAQSVEPQEQPRTTADPAKIVTGASSLPDPVRATLDEKFPGSFVVTFRHDESADQKKIACYEVELSKDHHLFKAYIADDGKFIRKEEMKASN